MKSSITLILLTLTLFSFKVSADFEKTIQFNLIEPSHVKLEILDKTGRVLKELANAEHESGKYKYPFTLKSEDFKTLDQVYYRLTINDQAITHRILIE